MTRMTLPPRHLLRQGCNRNTAPSLDGGIVDLSARYAKDYPTLREVIAAGKLVQPCRRGRRPQRRITRSTTSPGCRRCPRRKRSSASASTIRTAMPSTRTARTRRNIRACSCARHAPSSAIDTPLVRPRASEQLDYEGEIVLVIGKAGRHIAESAALDHIAALTLCNEGSIRDWVRHAKFNVTQGKNFRFQRQPRAVARALHRGKRRSPTSASPRMSTASCGRTIAPAG